MRYYLYLDEKRDLPQGEFLKWAEPLQLFQKKPLEWGSHL